MTSKNSEAQKFIDEINERNNQIKIKKEYPKILNELGIRQL